MIPVNGARPKKIHRNTHVSLTTPLQLHTDESCARNVKLCTKYISSGCTDSGCLKLHVCRFYYKGLTCRFCTNCRFGHDLTTAHNAHVLQQHGAEGGAVKRRLAVPWICKFYNSGRRQCKYGEEGHGCTALHICIHYVKGDCVLGGRCKRNHNIYSQQCIDLLRKAGIDTSLKPIFILNELHKGLSDAGTSVGDPERTWHSTLSLTSVPSADDDDVSDSSDSYASARPIVADNEPLICMYNLQKFGCLYKERCRHQHCSETFQWQYTAAGSKTWTNFDDSINKAIEESYVDPNNGTWICATEASKFAQISIDFDKMVIQLANLGNGKVRRLSTQSSVKVPEMKQSLATKWCWFWYNELGQWIEYGKGSHACEVDSKKLEEEYLESPNQTYTFKTSHNRYILDFQKMYQKNVTFHTERQVRRRPASLSDLKSRMLANKMVDLNLPVYWDKDFAKDGQFYKVVKLHSEGKSANEFKTVKDRFQETMPSTQYQIVSIERVQNLELWEGYQWKLNWMKKKTGKSGESLEKLLFHGTKEQYIEAVCKQGFDWRLSGMSVGTLWGKGSYFARDANYSSRYATNKMFLVRVLVGDYTLGNKSYITPPNKPGSSTDKYHSCVNDMQNPSIFVIFEHQQSYPEYIITYCEV